MSRAALRSDAELNDALALAEAARLEARGRREEAREIRAAILDRRARDRDRDGAGAEV